MGFLEASDFYTAPASTRFHNCFEGGLVMHSLSVHDTMVELNVLTDAQIEPESVAICGLFHDICKANYYVKEKRNKKINGAWKEIEVWGVKDQLPMGHGEKSVYLIQKFMQLQDNEALAIRWHLGGFDPGVHFNFPSGYSQKQAFKEEKLVALLASADMTATYLLDVYEEEK